MKAGRAARTFRLPLALLVATTLSGCIVRELWETRRLKQIKAEYAFVAGTVGGGQPGDHWLVVFIASVPCDDDWQALMRARDSGALARPPDTWTPELRALGARERGKLRLVEHVVLQQPGSWYARLAPGCYGVGAFQD